jgi:hypothetical protein
MPDQFNKTLYVSRPKEQALFLEALANGYYLDIYGMTGLGKTEFLKWIHDSQKQHDYLCSYVDLAADDLDIYNLIAEQLFDETVFPDDPFAEFKEIAYSQTSLSEDETFNKGLQNILTTYKVVLCFDNIQATAATWQQFAEKVLESQHPTNLIVITTGQKPLQLAPKLRQRAKSVFLSYLTEKAVEEFIQRLSQVKGFNVDDDVVSDIFRLTQGHPLSIALLVELWTNGFERDLNAVNLPQGIDQLMQAVVENLILNQLQLGAGYPAPKDILQAIAPLRYILRSSQRDLLSKFLPDSFANKPPFFADRLFGEFQKVNLYDWKEGFGHSLNPVVRQILLEDMRLNAREKFFDIQKTLVEMYDKLIRDNKGESQYLTEKLYHTAILLEQAPDINDRLAEEMQTYLDTYFVSAALLTEADQQFIMRLREKLGADTELAEHVEALLSVIDGFVKIVPPEVETGDDEEVEVVEKLLPKPTHVERTEIKQFDNFLQADSPLRILTIDTEGQGGVGKTIFLVQMQERCASQPEVFYTKELIDFFHLENRNKTGVMEQIAKSLKLIGFLNLVKEFRTAEDVAEREQLGRELQSTFLQEYDNFAQRLNQEGKRLALFFDSYEYIQQQSTTERHADLTNFSHWLETELFVYLAHQDNARLVIAGRYQPIELSTAYERVLLSPFSFENTKEFLQKSFDCADEAQLVKDIAPLEVIEAFHQLADAQPIFLALFVDWFNSSNRSPEELLADIEAQTGQVSSPVTDTQKRFFEKKLIDSIHQLFETSQLTVTYLAVAYRRMTADILSWLTGEATEKCEEDIDKFKQWSFIKQKPGNVVLLHDEMYRLLDNYFWKEDPQAYEASLKHLVKYYEQELLSNRDLSEADRDTYTSELLEYAFHAEFADGLTRFCNEFDLAMDDGKYDYSESLLREAENAAQTFDVSKTSQLDFLHITLRRVNYGLETGADPQQILNRIGEVIAQYQRDSRWQASEIQGQFLLRLGIAQFFIANYEAAIQSFSSAKRVFFDTGDDHWANWAVNWIGYSYYQQGDFSQAENWLNRSQKSFQVLLLQWESGTQHDALERRQILQGIQISLGNLAMVYAHTGRFYHALNSARIQLHVVRNLPRNSKEIARSLNAFAQTMALTGNSIEAKEQALAALDIFEKFNDRLLIGRVKLNLFWQAFNKGALSYPLEYYRADELTSAVKKSKLDVAQLQALLEDETIEILKAPAYLALGELYLVTTSFEKAEQALVKGLKYARDSQFLYHEVDALKNLVKLYYFWGAHAEQIKQYQDELSQLDCERYPELSAKYDLILGNIEFDKALNLFREKYLDKATILLRKAFIYYIAAADKLKTFSESRYHIALLIFHKRLSTFIQFANRTQISTRIIDKRLEDIKLTWREETDFDQIHDYACLCVSAADKLNGIYALEKVLSQNLYQGNVSWVILRIQCLIEAFASLITSNNAQMSDHTSLITWLIHHALFNHQLGYEYEAFQSIRLVKEQLDELKFIADTSEQLLSDPILQLEIRSLEARINAAEGTLFYRRAQNRETLEFELRGELGKVGEQFDQQFPGARSHALSLLKKGEEQLLQTIAAWTKLIEKTADEQEKDYLKQSALADRERLGSLRCRLGELLVLKEQFHEHEDQLGALEYLELALEDTKVRGETYHWAEAVKSYLTAQYFAGEDNSPTDKERIDYEKQLEESSALKEHYPLILGKLRLIQGHKIFSRYFQRDHEPNVKWLRKMLRYYVEACDFMARCDSAQFSLALRVLIVRIRMIRDKQTLEEIKKGLNGIWLDQPHLKERELATLNEFIQTMQDIIAYDSQ